MIKEFHKKLLSSPMTGENLEKEVAYFEPEFVKNRCRTSINSSWKFIFLDEFDSNILDENFDITSLNEIKVPSHIELNGYGKPKYVNVQYPWDGLEDLKVGELPKENKVGVYIKDIDINMEDKDYFIEFEGFESALFLYVNGQYVGYSSKNYTTSTFNINKFIVNGQNRIVAVVYKYSFASWYSDQDMWRMFGIHRNINLVVRNRFHIVDIKNSAVLQGNLTDGTINLELELSKFDRELKVEVMIKFKDKVIKRRNFDAKALSFSTEFLIEDVKKWSHEEPNLYTIELYLRHGYLECERVALDFGFRKIEFSENGELLLNGKPLFIKGVNRHEFDSRYGRALPCSSIEEDLINIKRNNFNAIRTSHYPNKNYFYKKCDEIGLLVMDEAPIETHGTRMHLKEDKEKEFKCLPGSDEKYKTFTIERGLNMYERDKNHPCIISWSLGNESYVGTNLEALSAALKEKDDSRFIHYEGCSASEKYSNISDVVSRMYTKPDKIRSFLKNRCKTPFILCEFAHSMGNSTGNFDEYIELRNEFKNFLGGFVWDYMDQALLVENKYYYGGDFREFPHDGNFCADGLVMADKTNTSKLATVKYFYQPYKFKIAKDKIEIFNDNLFVGSENVKFKYYVFEEENKILEKEFYLDILPQHYGVFNLNSNIKFEKDKRYFIRVEAFDVSNNEIASDEQFVKGEINKPLTKFSNEKSGELKVFKSFNHLTVQKDDFKVIFNGYGNVDGGLEAIIYKDKIYLNNIVLPTLFRATIDNEAMIYKKFLSIYMGASKNPFYIPFVREMKIIKETKNLVAIKFEYLMVLGANKFKNFEIIYTINSQKEIKVTFSYKPSLIGFKPPLIGLRFKLDKEFKEFSYIGLGKGDNYIDRYKGNKYGLYNSNAEDEFVKYSKPQECGNHEFTKEVSIKIDEVSSLNFQALGKTFSFKYLPYNEFEMENAERIEDLPNSRFNYLTIHAFNKGVGGDDSWGAPVHKKYRAKSKKYKQEFIIKIKED